MNDAAGLRPVRSLCSLSWDRPIPGSVVPPWSVVKSKKESLVVAAIVISGATLGFAGLSWLVGTLGVSKVAANAIARAVEIGSWGMFIVAIAATGGLVGAALWGALKFMMWRLGKAAVVA